MGGSEGRRAASRLTAKPGSVSLVHGGSETWPPIRLFPLLYHFCQLRDWGKVGVCGGAAPDPLHFSYWVFDQTLIL